MTTLDMHHSSNIATTDGLVNKFITTTFAKIQRWNDIRITQNALSKLTSAQLKDIGVCRSEIRTVARRK